MGFLEIFASTSLIVVPRAPGNFPGQTEIELFLAIYIPKGIFRKMILKQFSLALTRK